MMPRWRGCSAALKGTRREERPGQKGAQKEAACWLRVREEGRYGEERGGDLCRPLESTPGWLAGPGESGS